MNVPNLQWPSSKAIITPLIKAPVTALTAQNLALVQNLPNLCCLSCGVCSGSESLEPLLNSMSCLQHLDLALFVTNHINQLFQLLQSNCTLKGLYVTVSVEVLKKDDFSSLQDFLTTNQTLQHFGFEIFQSKMHPYMVANLPMVNCTYLRFLTAGLTANTSLKELITFVPHYTCQENDNFWSVVSTKTTLIKLQINFVFPDLWLIECILDFFYCKILPLLCNTLQAHTMIEQIRIQCNSSGPPIQWKDWKISKYLHNFYKAIFTHPTLHYVEINIPLSDILVIFYTHHESELLKLQEQVSKEPIVLEIL